MTLGAIGMVYLTLPRRSSAYAANILPPLMVIGFAMGTIMPASMQTATLGVDRQFAGVASATVNTSQQVGGSIGTALLNTLAATAAADYLAAHAPATGRSVCRRRSPAMLDRVLVGRGVLRRGSRHVGPAVPPARQGLSLSHEHEPVLERAAEPVATH